MGPWFMNIWTAGRIVDPKDPPGHLDLGRVPYDPEDCYISELVTCLSETARRHLWDRYLASHHTPDHTDAMIKGLMDSGRRMVFDYSEEPTEAQRAPIQVPGAMNDTTKGIGRPAKTYFSSRINW